MSENKFTPGPWHVGYGEAIRIYDLKGNSLAIATNIHMYGRRNVNEVEANANLIAAAPELLEALEEILADYTLASDEWCDDALDYALELISRVEKVIAKAKGE